MEGWDEQYTYISEHIFAYQYCAITISNHKRLFQVWKDEKNEKLKISRQRSAFSGFEHLVSNGKRKKRWFGKSWNKAFPTLLLNELMTDKFAYWAVLKRLKNANKNISENLLKRAAAASRWRHLRVRKNSTLQYLRWTNIFSILQCIVRILSLININHQITIRWVWGSIRTPL